jgi:hypothetical protein
MGRVRWSVEVTFEEARAHLGLALQRSHERVISVEATAWYHQPEPTFVDGLALVRRHFWHARFVMYSTAAPEFVPFPREAFDLLLAGFPLATYRR